MKDSKSVKIIAISIIAAVFINSLFKILGAGLPYFYKEPKEKSDISVKGYFEQRITSDEIQWEASFSTISKQDKKTAMNYLDRDKDKILRFLRSKGIDEDDITFKAVWDRTNTRSEDILIEGSRDRTNRVSYITGYTVGRTIIVNSTKLKEVEEASNEITDLISEGVDITSYSPKYYYSKLKDLKISTIEGASEDAYERAETAISGGNGKLGELQSASIGTMQILGYNADDDISYGGTLNTSNKEKVISVTVNQTYSIK
tara:strand:+ start:80 stop:856 length:777 start_codon:yes stop_codon:yes gene_type:complete